MLRDRAPRGQLETAAPILPTDGPALFSMTVAGQMRPWHFVRVYGGQSIDGNAEPVVVHPEERRVTLSDDCAGEVDQRLAIGGAVLRILQPGVDLPEPERHGPPDVARDEMHYRHPELQDVPEALALWRQWRDVAGAIANPNVELMVEEFAAVRTTYDRLTHLGARFDPMLNALMACLSRQITHTEHDADLDGYDALLDIFFEGVAEGFAADDEADEATRQRPAARKRGAA